jgi:LIM domain
LSCQGQFPWGFDGRPHLLKSCDIKNFGTRDLRHANIPQREQASTIPLPIPSSPIKGKFPTLPTSQPARASSSNSGADVYSSAQPAKGDTSYSYTTSPKDSYSTIDEEGEGEGEDPSANSRNGPSDTPTPSRPGLYSDGPSNQVGMLGRSNSSATANSNKVSSPLVSTSTGTVIGSGAGTRYGAALTGQPTGRSPARTWGGGTPTCGRCGTNVYFAEQVKAVGKTYHKGCLRCTECNTNLDSSRLTEKDGQPLCHRCYGKVM